MIKAGNPCRLFLSELHLRFRIGYHEGLLRTALAIKNVDIELRIFELHSSISLSRVGSGYGTTSVYRSTILM